MKAYFKNIVIAADQLANAMIAGSPDETVSSRVYRGAVLRHSRPALPEWRITLLMHCFFGKKTIAVQPTCAKNNARIYRMSCNDRPR